LRNLEERYLEEGDFDDINVLEIVDVTMAQKSDEDPEKAGFTLIVNDWTEDGLKLKMNFTNPLSISKGRNQDALLVKIKNPAMFVSKESGEIMDPKLQDKQMAQTIPKQVPDGVDPEVVLRRAQMSANAVKTMMIVQLILSVFLKGALNDLWGLYFTL
jgi:hypothetical protein